VNKCLHTVASSWTFLLTLQTSCLKYARYVKETGYLSSEYSFSLSYQEKIWKGHGLQDFTIYKNV